MPSLNQHDVELAREVLARRVREVLWRRGNLTHILHAGQIRVNNAFENATGQLRVLNIARQFGKSYWLVCKALEVARKKPKARIRFGAAFLTDVREFILPAFERILQDCPEDIKPKWRSFDSKWIFPNGAQIKIVGLDRNPNGMRGNSLDLIIIDEAGFVMNLLYLYRSVIIPATTHRPECLVILGSTPPATPAHPFVDFCQKAEMSGAYVKLTIFDNPMLGQEDFDRLAEEVGGYGSTTWRREYLCEFVTDSDSAIVPEWDDKWIGEDVTDDLTPYWHRYEGMDLGVKDQTACLFGYYNFRQAYLYIEDELIISGPTMTTDTLVMQIKAKEKELWKGKEVHRRIADNNNILLLQDMALMHDLSFAATSKETLHTMVNEVRMWVASGRVRVNPRCKQTIGCLRYGIWDNKRVQFSRNATYGHFDALAALVYLIRNIDGHTNPVPAYYGLTQDHFITADTSPPSQSVAALMTLFKPRKY